MGEDVMIGRGEDKSGMELKNSQNYRAEMLLISHALMDSFSQGTMWQVSLLCSH